MGYGKKAEIPKQKIKGGYEIGGERHVDEWARWCDSKWRSNWDVPYCSRSVPWGGRGACSNRKSEKKCRSCVPLFHNFVEDK